MTALVTGPVGLASARLALGAAEAGFYPAVICYLGRWFPRGQRTRALAVFLLAIPVANTIGMPLSSMLVEHAGTAGFAGWRVMLAVEGLPAVALAPLVIRLLPDSPAHAPWLSDSERNCLATRLASESPTGNAGFAAALTDPRTPALAAINAGLYFALYAIQFFLPQVVGGLFPNASVGGIGWMVGASYAVAAVTMAGWSRYCDRRGPRAAHLAIPAFLGAVSLAGATVVDTGAWAMLAGITILSACVLAAIPVFWNLAAHCWSGVAAAAGIAAVNSISSLASFGGPYLTGALTDATGGFRAALLAVSAALVVTGAGALIMRPILDPLPYTMTSTKAKVVTE